MHMLSRGKALGLAFVVTGLLLGNNPVTSATVYTDRAAWEAAVGAFTTDTFSNPITAALSITLDSGVVSEMTGTSTALFGYINGVKEHSGAPDAYAGFVNQHGHYQTVWTFPAPITAFGGDFAHVNIPNGLNVTGNFDGSGDQTISIAQLIPENMPPGEGQGFFGLVGLAPFQSILFRSNDGDLSGTNGDAFYIDNFSFNPSSSAVPVPAALPLFASGLGVLALLARRRRRQSQTAR
ncbi:MAG: PEP-CTERM sorting domain-containing protein [Xanthobacteraceae bacterium]